MGHRLLFAQEINVPNALDVARQSKRHGATNEYETVDQVYTSVNDGTISPVW